MKKIGIISDTHGKLRNGVIELLQGCDSDLSHVSDPSGGEMWMESWIACHNFIPRV